MITASEMGRRGAAATNKILTPEQRSAASKKGWANRWKKLGVLPPRQRNKK